LIDDTSSASSTPQTGYSAQMLAAPDWANSYYYKAGHPKNENWQRWCV
jgi:hypothetical protein